MRRHRIAIPALVALALGMASVAPAAFAAPSADTGVGVVGAYRPAAGRYTFARPPQGKAVPVQIGAVVVAGDRVALPAGGSLTVQLANGEVLDFKGPGQFTIPDARPLGRLAAIFRSLPSLFDDEYRLEGTAASRGSDSCGKDGQAVRPIVVPILGPGARIVAGERDLPLAWRGGCPPFDVRVLAGGDELVVRDSITGWQVRLDDVRLEPGSYALVLTDAGGRRHESRIEAVAAGPALPGELAADSSPLGVTAQAIWLASHDGGRWRLESFERLRPLIRAGDPLASTIGDGVLWGEQRP